MANVVNVVLDAMDHFVERIGLAAPAIDLGPAGDPWLDGMSEHVLRNQALVLLVVCNGVWPRTNQGHLASQYVEDLWQLVEGGAPEKRAKRRNTRVVLRRLSDVGSIL